MPECEHKGGWPMNEQVQEHGAHALSEVRNPSLAKEAGGWRRY